LIRAAPKRVSAYLHQGSMQVVAYQQTIGD